MFLLFQIDAQPDSISSIKFTFHYVSIISRRRSFPMPIVSTIYIPLCFYYFSCNGSDVLLSVQFTFHYVSIISIMNRGDWDRFKHLHSIMFLLFPEPIVEATVNIFIYIPLCFYYFGVTGRADLRVVTFTFHYVSIISYIRSQTIKKESYLHSIMFLLFPPQAFKKNLRFLFTFHYVSIISIVGSSTSRSIAYLHSIMFLLFQGNAKRREDCCANLHSIMFLLFPFRSCMQA